MRYLSPYASKNLSSTERKALHDAGISVGVVWESTAKRPESGHAAGVADAKAALALLKSLGAPDSTAVYFAVDYDTTVGPHITAYLEGAASVLGLARVGVYGGYKIVKACFDKALITYGWQTYAWSGGKWDARAQLQQYSNGLTLGGGDVDYCHLIKPAGLWEPKAVTPAPKPTPKPTPKPSGLSVDGVFGTHTKEALQKALRVKVDGDFGPESTKALQRKLKVSRDGEWREKTTDALQRYLKVKADGVLGPITIMALQKRLNAGTF